jgi:NAD(P)-dependent dehydrogenase (short-subunit alcohol dehydrogenase family)
MPLAIVTGANVGLGFETTRGLLAMGFDVVITSRDQTKGERALQSLRSEFPESKVSCLSLDLSQRESVDSFAQSFRSKHQSWDVLINNAGAKVLADYRETDSGVEYHFGVNAVGHFAITADLMPYRSKNARVVSVASIVARFAPKVPGPIGTRSNYLPGPSYAASKLSNLLFALELQSRFGSDTFSSLAAHPGFARAEPYGPTSTRFFESFLAQSARRGALPIVSAASDLKIPGGSYLAPNVLELWGKPSFAKMPETATGENQIRNWEILEQLSGRKLTF